MLATSGNAETAGASTGSPVEALPERRPIRRVLMTADAAGGVWQYSIDLAVGLRAHGIETTLALMGPSMTAGQREELIRSGLQFVESSYTLEWQPSPWEDVDRAGHWLLEVASKRRPDVVHLNGFAHAALGWESPPLVVAHSCVRTWWR